jgi:DNA-binding transcriptional ArsR family regulator
MNSQVATVEERKFTDRWGAAMNDGYLLFPRTLLWHQGELGLSDGEVVVLLNLLASWWDEADWPYPAVSTLAHRMKGSVRTVQRHLRTLEAKGFIERIRNIEGNGRAADLKVTRYVLTGTVKKLNEASRLPPAPRPARQPMPSKYNAGRTVQPSAREVFGGLET